MTSCHEISRNRLSVYVLRAGPDRIKIGISSNVQKRIYSLQPSSPYRIELVRAWPTMWALSIEQRAHAVLQRYRENGEWFAMPEQAAVLVIEHLIAMHPRNPAHMPAPAMILFCEQCRRCGKGPPSTARFYCSRCGRDQRMQGVFFI